ncbi:MAG TPA: protein tyrosine phosphatase, partial [Aliiroseovarius sp.]|nr:protein tyrosine phosphatase [Aliiroseovarius sp.]
FKAWRQEFKATGGADITTPQGRRRAAWHMHLADYAFFRRRWTNLHKVADGVWRSNQPGRNRYGQFPELGLKTILYLRGERHYSSVQFEQEACDAQGITLLHMDLSARSLAEGAEYVRMLEIMETAEKPLLIHCKSGADRTGLAAALYLIDQGLAPVEEAKKQLSFKYLHWKIAEPGVLDALLEAYEADSRDAPMPVRTWLLTRYDRDAIAAGFRPWF